MRFLLVFSLLFAALQAQALELRVGPQALQRALSRQMLAAPDGRYYLHGHRGGGCSLYATDAHIHFAANRIVLDLHLAGKLGSNFAGGCLGVNWNGDAEVSMLPQAQGATLGFTDVRVERLTGNGSLDRLLSPLLTSRVPAGFKVNAMTLIGKMLHTASERSQTTFTLDSLSITSMQVVNNALLLTLDGSVSMP